MEVDAEEVEVEDWKAGAEAGEAATEEEEAARDAFEFAEATEIGKSEGTLSCLEWSPNKPAPVRPDPTETDG